MSTEYHKTEQIHYSKRINCMLSELPACCRDYYNYMMNMRNSSIRTCYTYILGYKIFFNYLVSRTDLDAVNLYKRDPASIKCNELEKITENDIYNYLSYLTYYDMRDLNEDLYITSAKNPTESNSVRAKNNKLSGLKSLYKYLSKTHKISINAIANVDFIKEHKTLRTPTRLEIDEAAKLMDIVSEYTEHSCESTQAKSANKRIHYRDMAILAILCSTGIRVSELVALNIDDVNYMRSSLLIYRKGGYEQEVFINSDTSNLISCYINNERYELLKGNISEKALFVSLHKKRLSVRSVQTLVNKYTLKIEGCDTGNGKSKISPHKLRATYANLFLENGIGDLKELSENMGHHSMNTTTIYSGITKDRVRMEQAKNLKIRE